MKNKQKSREKGFTLFECVVGIALIAIAVLGLAQMFTLSVMNNARSDRITNAVFLAQQQVDIIRNLTVDELTQLQAANGIDLNGDGVMDVVKDELIDVNGDGVNDYRRIMEIRHPSQTAWEVIVQIYTAEQFDKARADLLQNPQAYGVKASIDTVISR
jgi:prepilin-type N-terminal cleavage/methylation domain-containing protein